MHELHFSIVFRLDGWNVPLLLLFFKSYATLLKGLGSSNRIGNTCKWNENFEKKKSLLVQTLRLNISACLF